MAKTNGKKKYPVASAKRKQKREVH